jgi:hypothetical protein
MTIGSTVKFETAKGIAQGVLLGEYLGPVPTQDGYISGTIYYVGMENGQIAHVRAGFIRDVDVDDETAIMEMGVAIQAMKAQVKEAMINYLNQNLKFTQIGDEGGLIFDLPDMKEKQKKGYISDIAGEIADIFEEII